MSERDIEFAAVVLVMANFINQDPSTLAIVDDFMMFEGASKEIDIITAFATELNNRLGLMNIGSLANDMALIPPRKSYQLRRVINALGQLGQMMICDLDGVSHNEQDGAFTNLALGTLAFYDLDNEVFD